jgi:hypothetical protein
LRIVLESASGVVADPFFRGGYEMLRAAKFLIALALFSLGAASRTAGAQSGAKAGAIEDRYA